VPATPREDLVNILLKYGPNDTLQRTLRLNLDVAPVPLASSSAPSWQATMPGWPNGRHPSTM
jgi:hypothetical protein